MYSGGAMIDQIQDSTIAGTPLTNSFSQMQNQMNSMRTPPTSTRTPPTTPPTTAKEIECPEPNAQRIGDLSQSGKERVKGYKLSVDKKICIKEWEDVPFVDAYLPSASVVTTTAGIAAVATTSALLAKPLADLLLKVIKPLVKKVSAKVKKALGKTPYRPTASEIRTNQYREKKGLLPKNFEKDHQKKMKKEKSQKKEEKKK